MKTGRYNLKELLNHNEIEQIIIPEIQRDYVWQNNNVIKLMESILSNYRGKKSEKLAILIKGEPIKEKSINSYLLSEYEKLRYSLKIGFIYAYHDNEYPGKFFLIDGQQRLTTLYLLLFALYKKTGKIADFRQQYFKENLLKLDYKVRETSHDFLFEFIKYRKEDITNSSRFYKSEYEEDITVKNILSNYKAIDSFIEKFELGSSDFLEYVEEFIEFNYFDTNISEQGEQLYLYMNSRGEHLSYQEIIRSEIIKKEESNDKKKDTGGEWEKWENFFWTNRGINENADIGFEEFLKWATIIHIGKQKNPDVSKMILNRKVQTIAEAKENYIHRNNNRLEEQRELLLKYQVANLDSQFLSRIFNALIKVFDFQQSCLPIEREWLSNKIKTKDYIYLLPLIYFVSETKIDDNEIEKVIKRLAMFFKNVTYFESNAKSPDRAVVVVLEMIRELVENEKTDMVFFLDERFSGKYKSILTEFERRKLREVSKPNVDREKLESFFWNATLNEKISEFFYGDLTFTLDYLDEQSISRAENSGYSLDEITRLEKFLRIVGNTVFSHQNDDLLRRCLLTYDDYLLSDEGGSGHIDGYKTRWTFCLDYKKYGNEWADLLNDSKCNKERIPVFKFFIEIESQYTTDFSEIDFFHKRIRDFSEKDWREPFIKEPAILRYCRNKRILWNNDEHGIVLLESMKATKAVYVQCALLACKFKGWKMGFFDTKKCYIKFDFDKENKQIIVSEKGYQLEVRFCVKNNEYYWEMYLFYQNGDSYEDKLKVFEGEHWNKEDNYLVNNLNRISYNKDLSIFENIDFVEEKVNNELDKLEQMFVAKH